MDEFYKYLIIFSIIYFLFLKKDIKYENFKNIQLEDIQYDTTLAGGIDDFINPNFNESELNSELLRYELKKQENKLKSKELKEPKSNDNYGYYPYEVRKSKQLQVPKITNIKLKPLFPYEKDKKTEIDFKTNPLTFIPDSSKDCKGVFTEWDTTECEKKNLDDYPCTLKSKVFEVLKEVEEGGKECTYKNKIIRDGDIVFDYCKEGTHMDRCGDKKNRCKCDIEKSQDCIPEDISYKKCDCKMNLEHIKPQGRGKCQKINIDVDEDFTEKFVKGYLNNTLTSIFFLDEPEKY